MSRESDPAERRSEGAEPLAPGPSPGVPTGRIRPLLDHAS